MEKKHSDFYQDLRGKIQQWAESTEGKTNKWLNYILSLPDLFYLLCKLMADGKVPTGAKIILGAAIAYVVSPIDLIPEVLLGPIGYLDDIAIVAFALDRVINRRVDAAIIQKHWPGEGDVLEKVRDIISSVDNMLGSGLVKKIKEWINGFDKNDKDSK